MRTKCPALYLCECYQKSQSWVVFFFFLNNTNYLLLITTNSTKGFLTLSQLILNNNVYAVVDINSIYYWNR